MPLQRRRERYIIIHTWKICHGDAPNDVGMVFYDGGRLGTNVRVPSLVHSAQRSIASAYEQSFGVKAARLWNFHPKSVNSCQTLDEFKIALSNFLDHYPDQPPIPGYHRPNNNSLLEWCCGVDPRRTCVPLSTWCEPSQTYKTYQNVSKRTYWYVIVCT